MKDDYSAAYRRRVDKQLMRGLIPGGIVAVVFIVEIVLALIYGQ